MSGPQPPEAAANAAANGAGARALRPTTAADIIARWGEEGPLVRVPTGIRALDEACRGGFPIPWRVMIVGAPSAGKTFIEVVIADAIVRRLAEEHVCVGILGVDEEPDDLTVRFAQIAGFTVAQCEQRAPEVLQRMHAKLLPLRIQFYNASFTIEAAAEALHEHAEGRQTALFIDSLHAARSSVALLAETPRAIVEANVAAIRVASISYRMLVVSTVEANRASYENRSTAKERNDLAAGAESRAIEFGAQTQLVVRTPEGHSEIASIVIAKNRRARSSIEFFVRIDRDRHTLTECTDPRPPVDREAKREDTDRKKEQKQREKSEKIEAQRREKEQHARAKRDAQDARDDAACLECIRAEPGIVDADLRAAMAARLDGCEHLRTKNAVARLQLRRLVRVEKGPSRTSPKCHYLVEAT